MAGLRDGTAPPRAALVRHGRQRHGLCGPGRRRLGSRRQRDQHGAHDDDGLGVITYQWQRGGVDIGGATGSTYTLVDADVGALITAVASYTDGQGNDTEALSSRAIGQTEALQRFVPAVAVPGNGSDVLSFRTIGQTEAVQRFIPAVAVPGITFRAIGQTEALQRFVPAIAVPGNGFDSLSFRAIGEAEAIQRFVAGVAIPGSGLEALTYRTIGEAEALQRFVS